MTDLMIKCLDRRRRGVTAFRYGVSRELCDLILSVRNSKH